MQETIVPQVQASSIVRPRNDGPYEITFAGIFEVVTEGGRVLPAKGNKVWLCRCGHSNSKPFCDGSHRKMDFQSNLDVSTQEATEV